MLMRWKLNKMMHLKVVLFLETVYKELSNLKQWITVMIKSKIIKHKLILEIFQYLFMILKNLNK